LEQILAASSLKVIVAGGISSLKDLQALKSYAPRVTGVIIGQALYTNRTHPTGGNRSPGLICPSRPYLKNRLINGWRPTLLTNKNIFDEETNAVLLPEQLKYDAPA